jgi:hypothetical protein
MKYLKLFENVESKDSEVTERIDRLKKFIDSNPRDGSGILRDLENIKNNLDDKGEWVGGKNSDAYQVWGFHYKGFTKSQIEMILNGLKDEGMDEVLEVVKKYLDLNPNKLDKLIDAIYDL